jgi:lysophospholipid acyltransferase (LPLAT)-like uncharacterized protein
MPSLRRLAGWLIWLYAKLVRITARWKIEGSAHRAAALAHGRVIYALWHQDGPCFCAAMAGEDSRRLSLMVLGGRKLDFFLGFADLEGFRAHATGNRAQTAAAMAEVRNDVRAGCWSAITPDGPIGPPRVCKPGIVDIAREVDGVVLPLGISCSRHIQTRNWDGARLPLPFARFELGFGPPIVAAAYADDEVLRRTIERGIEACRRWQPELPP